MRVWGWGTSLAALVAFQSSVVTVSVPLTEEISVDPDTNLFVDGLGRTRIFHGVNVVQKSTPYHPVTSGPFNHVDSMVQQDFDYLNAWGMNIVRLGAMWNAVEPERGVYNATYIHVLKDLVDNMGKNGIYTLLDFHQDLFSEHFCGDGMPDYILDMLKPLNDKCGALVGSIAKLIKLCKSVKDYGLVYDDHGIPKNCGAVGDWWNMYMTPEVASAFDNFFNSEAAMNYLVQYFVELAKAFKDSPYAVGFDLFNEPFPGDVYRKPALLLGGRADKEYLQPLYEKIQAAVRAVDASKIMMYEPVQFPDTFPILGGIVSHAGFTRAPGGPEMAHKNAMSYHIYCCEAGADMCSGHEVLPSKNARCDKFVTDKYNKRTQDFQRVGGAGIITEFGACSNPVQCVKEINRVADNADRDFQSWMYWQYKFYDTPFFNGDGTNMTWKITALSRTYAQAIMGKPLSIRFDTDSGAFRLQYEVKAGNAPTQVYFNQAGWYPNGFEMIVSPGIQVVKARDYLLELSHTASAPAGTIVDFALVRKAEDIAGVYTAKHASIWYEIDWAVESAAQLDTIEVVLSKAYHWRKEVRVINDSGDKVCVVSLTKAYSGSCKIPLSKRNEFLFGYRIELYKYYFFDKIPVFVDSFRPSYLGPLSAGKRVRLVWKSKD